jgi:hypothetical protein
MEFGKGMTITCIPSLAYEKPHQAICVFIFLE